MRLVVDLCIALLILSAIIPPSSSELPFAHHLNHDSKLPWCPPKNFLQERQLRKVETKTVLITEIHGQLERTGHNWGRFLAGALLARNIHYHLGIIGFDRMYINVIYNDTVHPTPPTVNEIYHPDQSCVSAWNDTGLIEWRYVPYAGPESRWPIDSFSGKPKLEKDLYKTLRGINPTYDEIVRKREADWVMILDADELLVPVNWKPKTRHDWCSHKWPSVLEMAIGQMLATAMTVNLEEYPKMLEYKGQPRNASEACALGYGVSTGHAMPSCREIGSIILPVRFWTKHYPNDGSSHMPRMPLLRAKVPSSYPHNNELALKEVEKDHQYHQWKSIHQVRFTPRLEGQFTMHYGHADSFKIIAPRDFHGSLSLEIAHVQKDCNNECRGLLVTDPFLNDASLAYYRCMAGLPK